MIGLIIMWAAAIGTMMAALWVYRHNHGKREKKNCIWILDSMMKTMKK